jgi:hypothetical protein
MIHRKVGVSEARRLLPELVKTLDRDGGRIDITYRGEPRVSLMRVSDLRDSKWTPLSGSDLAAALRVELLIPADELAGAISELRSTQGHPRTKWLSPDKPTRRQKSKRKDSDRQ